MVDFTFWDYFAIALYFVGIYVVGFFRKKKSGASGIDDFLVAGRKATLPAFVATLVSTWYGGILGVGEYSYLYGLVNWFVWGVSYYVFAAIYAFTVAGKIRESKDYTITDRLYRKYGKAVGLTSAFVFLITTSPASYFLMIGTLLHIFMPQYSIAFWVIAGSSLSIIYVYKGGLSTVIKTDLIQFLLMFVGFGIIIPFCFFDYGGLEFISSNVPETHLTLTGTIATQSIIMWMLLAVNTFVDPGFYQRCLAVESPQKAKKGILISIGFWCIFDFMTTAAGLYAVAILPNLENPVFAYPLLANEVLPTFVKGLFFVGMLATIMSTIDSNSFLCSLVFGKDILSHLTKKETDLAQVEKFTKFGLLVTFVIGVTLALFFESIIDYWKTIGSLSISALLVPILLSFGKKQPSSNLTIVGIVFGFSAAFLANAFSWEVFGINEPIYYGLFASTLIFSKGIWDNFVVSKQ
ncbi:MAG: sodium:solute symporter family protein [Calditrichaeota bacterium]|nr:MAG: sodium:solute symporter family protein [Calditrichota bacterium]